MKLIETIEQNSAHLSAKDERVEDGNTDFMLPNPNDSEFGSHGGANVDLSSREENKGHSQKS